jgi:hypothetical protein
VHTDDFEQAAATEAVKRDWIVDIFQDRGV